MWKQDENVSLKKRRLTAIIFTQVDARPLYHATEMN